MIHDLSTPWQILHVSVAAIGSYLESIGYIQNRYPTRQHDFALMWLMFTSYMGFGQFWSWAQQFVSDSVLQVMRELALQHLTRYVGYDLRRNLLNQLHISENQGSSG